MAHRDSIAEVSALTEALVRNTAQKKRGMPPFWRGSLWPAAKPKD